MHETHMGRRVRARRERCWATQPHHTTTANINKTMGGDPCRGGRRGRRGVDDRHGNTHTRRTHPPTCARACMLPRHHAGSCARVVLWRLNLGGVLHPGLPPASRPQHPLAVIGNHERHGCKPKVGLGCIHAAQQGTRTANRVGGRGEGGEEEKEDRGPDEKRKKTMRGGV